MTVKSKNTYTTSKSKTAKKSTNATAPKQVVTKTKGIKGRVTQLNERRKNFLNRRPHRSFRLTDRRDYKRSLKLPGFFMLTLEVSALLWKNKKTFGLLGLCFFVLIILFGLMGSQDTYQKIQELLNGTAPEGLFEGATGEISKAGLLLFTILTQGINTQPDSGQQIIAVFISLYVWLTAIWLLRNVIADKKVKLRDGLYNAGAPILPTLLMFMILLIQLIPVAIAIIISSAAFQSGLIDGGVAAMLATIGIALMLTLSMYWITSTIFALIIITLPGMYPMRAMAIAGDLVVGRRLRLLLRILWMFFVVICWWVVVMIPVILLDTWIKSIFEQINWLPVIPVAFLIMSTFTVIWSATYIYLLYRKVVDDDASPV
jgi:hypothetical protein